MPFFGAVGLFNQIQTQIKQAPLILLSFFEQTAAFSARASTRRITLSSGEPNRPERAPAHLSAEQRPLRSTGAQRVLSLVT